MIYCTFTHFVTNYIACKVEKYNLIILCLHLSLTLCHNKWSTAFYCSKSPFKQLQRSLKSFCQKLKL